MRRLLLVVRILSAVVLPMRTGERLGAQECNNMCDGVTDVSDNTYEDSCGNVNWELKGEMAVSQIIYDEGPYEGFGTCYNYYDCDGNYTSDFLEGTEQIYDEGPDSGNESESFYWWLDDWTVSYTNVQCSNGFQGSSSPSFTDSKYTTRVFEECC